MTAEERATLVFSEHEFAWREGDRSAHVELVRAAIEGAIREEREACAKQCEEMAETAWINRAQRLAFLFAAAQLRKRATRRRHEQILTEWDDVRKKIADGCTHDGPRLWLEGVLDEVGDPGLQPLRVSELEAACRIALATYSMISPTRLPGEIAGSLVHARETLRRALGGTVEMPP